MTAILRRIQGECEYGHHSARDNDGRSIYDYRCGAPYWAKDPGREVAVLIRPSIEEAVASGRVAYCDGELKVVEIDVDDFARLFENGSDRDGAA